jgi:DNA invertase Pin-like site-specific DNA recombinase
MQTMNATPAAQYLRVSHGGRDYPLELQQTAIAKYAEQHNLAIISTYSDVGKSGLTMKERSGFRRLIQDVITGRAAYRAVLVYDISRWGRFQDTDEAAHYEFLCTSVGIAVHYCAEAFENNRTPHSLIQKSIRRLMAADYSRQLSIKCFRGQKRLAEYGFKMGGQAGYGFRRMVLGADGQAKHVLKTGEYKSLSADRIVLIPGPRKEINQVREIYREVIRDRKTPTAIAFSLNSRGAPWQYGREWSHYAVKDILTNPKYAGLNVWNRRAIKLHGHCVFNSPKEWVTRSQAYPPLIDMTTFERVQRILEEMAASRPEAELLSKLKEFLAQQGRLTQKMIDATSNLASAQAYRRRFGNLRRLYKLIGYQPEERFKKSDGLKRAKLFQERLVKNLRELYGQAIRVQGGTNNKGPILCLNGGLKIAVRVCSKVPNRSGVIRWRLYCGVGEQSQHFDLLCLLSDANNCFYRYYLVPPVSRLPEKRFFAANDDILASGLRLNNLANLRDAAICLLRSANSPF